MEERGSGVTVLLISSRKYYSFKGPWPIAELTSVAAIVAVTHCLPQCCALSCMHVCHQDIGGHSHDR